MRQPTKPTAASPSTPMSTTAPTMMNTIFMVLSLEGGGTGARTVPGVAAPAEDAAEENGADASTAAPHLLQKRVPGVRFAPQELQKAMVLPRVQITRWAGV